jgi:hypothetical protein
MGDLTSVASLGLNTVLGTQAIKQQEKRADKALDRDIDEIRARDAASDDERRRRLRAAVARERARAGGAGTLAGGTTDAVLRGLQEEAEAEARAQKRLSNLRIDGLREDTRSANRRNLLDTADNVLGASLPGFRLAGRSLLDV